MFLRALGNRFFLFHSYRDGLGKVKQRRLHTFVSPEALRAHLEPRAWAALQANLTSRCPELSVDWERLRAQAQSMLQASPATRRPVQKERLQQACRVIARLIDEEPDPGPILEELEKLRDRALERAPRLEDARKLVQSGQLPKAESLLLAIKGSAEALLPVRRTKSDPSESRAQPYLEALDLLAEVYRRSGRLQDALEMLQVRLRHCPTPEARTACAILFLQLGHAEAALAQLQQVPGDAAERWYNEAAVHLSLGQERDALVPILRGLSRDKAVAKEVNRLLDPRKVRGQAPGRGAAYWERFGALWTPSARQFLQRVAAEPMVRWYLRLKDGKKARTLVKEFSLEILLEKVSRACDPPTPPPSPAPASPPASRRSAPRKRR